MYLRHLKLIDFKNIKEFETDFSQINCFVGNNGVGKTNMLDSIYYLSFCKSYFSPNDTSSIREGADFFAIHGDYVLKGTAEHFSCTLEADGRKQIKHSGKLYKRHSEHIGRLPSVMVAPNDQSLITGGSENRRRFVDIIVSQQDKTYLNNLIRYNKAVEQRNKLLKNYLKTRFLDETALDIWDEQAAFYGDDIRQRRREFFAGFAQPFRKYYDYVSCADEQVGLDYRTYEGGLLDLLGRNREKDKLTGYTTVGIHRDELEFGLNGRPIRYYGSQGQQKTFLLALKLAQFDYLYEHLGLKPLLLLDDVFDKFDFQRVNKLLQLISQQHFGQVFLTDTHIERVESIIADEFKDKTKIFRL